MLCKKGVLRNFTKFTGKHLNQSLFFNKVAALSPAKKNLKKHLFNTTPPDDYFCKKEVDIHGRYFSVASAIKKFTTKYPKNSFV